MSIYTNIYNLLSPDSGGMEMMRRKNYVTFRGLIFPKADGGLRLREIQTFNQALLAEIAWCMITSLNCLLARTLLGKYCHTSSILDIEASAS